MLVQVAAVTGAGCVRRCFQCWLALARERWWKTQLSSMEVQVGLLEAKLRGYEKRPIQVGCMQEAGSWGVNESTRGWFDAIYKQRNSDTGA